MVFTPRPAKAGTLFSASGWQQPRRRVECPGQDAALLDFSRAGPNGPISTGAQIRYLFTIIIKTAKIKRVSVRLGRVSAAGMEMVPERLNGCRFFFALSTRTFSRVG
jgi:hypothetical protein